MRTSKIFSGVLLALACACVVSPASAAQTLRVQVEQRGDFALIGNTFGWDCGAGAALPVVGTVPGAGTCGSNNGDTAPDVFWRSENPGAGQATAGGVVLANARSTAMLDLPAGATITHAFLYWAARLPANTPPDTQVVLDRPGGFTATIDAATTYSLDPAFGTANTLVYEAVADVTGLVQANGEGAYRVAEVLSQNFINLNEEVTFSGWSMVVFYEDATQPPRNLALFDGLDRIGAGAPSEVTLSGFLVPNAGFDAKLGALTYEGDDQSTGDALLFGPDVPGLVTLSDAANPANNFFNSSRSWLGSFVGVAGDLPQLTGQPRTMGSIDMDVIDVTAQMTAGQSSAVVRATSSQDVYFLGAFITSISTFKPEFGTSSKAVVDVNGVPTRPGDVLEYTLTITNTGNDASVDTVVTDPLPAGVNYVPDSIAVDGTPVLDSDPTIDVVADVITIRLGAGADGTTGGTLAVGESHTITFQVTIDGGASGTISNQATIAAAGQQGAPNETTPTDGNGGSPGQPPTDVVVGACASDADCAAPFPICDLSVDPSACVECLQDSHCPSTAPVCQGDKTCGPCTSDADCSSPLPACLGSGACGECSATNDVECTSNGEVCDVANALCVQCNTDADCTGTPATPFCSGNNLCVECTGNAQCPGSAPVCQLDGSCGPCGSDADCASPTPACQASGACGECSSTNATECTPSGEVCETGSATCVACVVDGDCAGTPATPFCSPGNACVECLQSSQCPGNAPVCNASNVCNPCVTDADCASPTPACQASGACGECSATNATECTPAGEVCDVGAAVCVACVSDADCAGTPATPRCQASTNTCVECTAPSHCPGSAPVCQPTGVCGACTSDADCASPTPACNAGTGVCVECTVTNDDECTGTQPVCDTAASTCVGCLTDGDCAGTPATPHCQAGTQVCVECTSSAQCPVTAPVCQPSGVCAGCASDADCASPTPACSTSTGLCVECTATNQTECTGATPVCDTTATLCVGCVVDADCAGTPATPRCQSSSATCVECLTGTDCTAAAPVCSAAGACGPCTADADCASPTPACQVATGACVECTTTNETECTGATPACDAAAATCVECMVDGDCSGATPRCQVSSHTCVECATSDDCSTTEPVCSPSGTCGPCASDADCASPTPACLASGACGECSATNETECTGATPVCDTSNATCVGCLVDADCSGTPSTPFCQGTTNTCVECTTDQQCPATAPVCQTTPGTCICPADGGCGAVVDDGELAGGGCACTVPASRSTSAPGLLLAALGLGLFAGRRRRAA